MKILIIGAGVSGLTVALSLRNAGFEIVVVAAKFAPQITSVVAGALWEWPPAVCGYHHDQISLSRSKEWCMCSYEVFRTLAKNAATGVHWRQVSFYFREPVLELEAARKKMEELRPKVEGFRHDAALIAENHINPNIGMVDAYAHNAPMIDTDVYMKWLFEQSVRSGCRIVQDRISGRLESTWRTLQDRYSADFIVNCAGLGSGELAGEAMYPLRGALVRVINDGTRFSKIENAFCVSHDERSERQDIIFIVPRGTDRLVLGGLAEPDEWNTEIGLEYQPIAAMLERCIEFLPVLRFARVDAAEPVRVGLRPFRKGNVRLEEEVSYPVIHNYGHGGAGVTFSHGCAAEVVDRVNRRLNRNRAPICEDWTRRASSAPARAGEGEQSRVGI